MPRVRFLTFGCRVNKGDSDAIAAALDPRFTVVGESEAADYVVVNTCTVTNDADSAARQAIRRIARESPGAKVVATGCYAEVCPEALVELGVAAVVGGRSRSAVPDALLRLDGGAASGAQPCWLPAPGALVGHTRAFLQVQDGCDARCAYCVIPRARGPGRSLPFDEALARIGSLGARHAEVVLAGIHLGTFGGGPAGLVKLVEAAHTQELVRRLRLSSIEPDKFPLALLASPARELLCEHFHVPLQSGSDRILAKMRRPYRAARYAALLERIAAAVPGACLGADVMVGFPGETDADHRATVALVEALPLAYLHVFTFSPRAGTGAAALPGRVNGRVARARAQELIASSERRFARFLARQVGRTLEVVVEAGEGQGTSREYAPVRFTGGEARRGALVRVRIEGAGAEDCRGTIA